MTISIIIPVYNGEKLVSRAIRSALDQNYPKDKYEVIVINDGSTDNTASILNIFKDQLKIISHDKNKGLAAARNSGYRAAKGRYLVNLDSDDYIHSELIRTQSLFLSLTPQFDAVSCDYYIVDSAEDHLSRKSAVENPIACGIMFRMEHLIDIGLYDEDFLAREEEDLRLRFEKKYKIFNIPLPLYRYTKHSSNLTSNNKVMDEHLEKLNKKHNKNSNNGNN